jgi:hypothetical protein
MEELSPSEKVKRLKEVNPKLSDTEACILLGITKKELDEDRLLKGVGYDFLFDTFGFNKKED